VLPPTITALLQTMGDKAVKAQIFCDGMASAL